ncbi:carbonic anhydrase [Mycolicibacterium sarraceniae]|uniref:Carbonic anhydrase n=1 Tax=Mycolicibacterium sarraceniae TaxID=1534348 RepID=A0A7I7SVU6_9MYCO|nr:carbonic anhydrase [Mycolicibacterium sarraceniae]BBY60421.1 carbonic anhydrase [Mycolicibacterium sarraceniae]
MSDPLIAWQRLRAGNELFFAPVRGRRGEPVVDQPIAAVFRCADAPIGSEMVLGQSWGSLLDVSTWGHVIDAGVLATMEYAVETLEVPLIVVLGHNECAAMRAALRAWDEAVIPEGATRTAVQQALSSIVRRGAGADSVDTVTAAHIVEVGVALLERSPVIARRVDAGRCGIICTATDCNSGLLRTHATIGPVGEAPDDLLECV